MEDVKAGYKLSDDLDKVDKNYNLYIAKKKGQPKDDFPALSLTSNVRGVGYERFSLCCFSVAFIKSGAAADDNRGAK